jgi:hypothetical protein
MLTQMAYDWAADKIFSDKHIVPHDEYAIFLVFPAAKSMMSVSSYNDLIMRTECGLIFEFMDQRRRDKSVKVHDPRATMRVLPIFDTCKVLHKDQLVSLQKAIDAVKLTWGRKLSHKN